MLKNPENNQQAGHIDNERLPEEEQGGSSAVHLEQAPQVQNGSKTADASHNGD